MKSIPTHERAAAITAILTASRQRKHVAIRPAGVGGNSKTPGIAVDPHAPDVSKELDEAINAGMESYPDSDQWEVFGSDNCEEPDDEEDGYAPDFSMYTEPMAFGMFGMYPA